ncbi:MAG: choloylglycine hydrolase family protein [Ruminococcaceae bacterium]|nr:choloylglycine hydrolase family protein [Oscillospiraceae bacterium]
MCTAIAMNFDGLYFGRTMDIEFEFDGRIVTAPRRFLFSEKNAEGLSIHYAVTGMARVVDGYPLFADAFNEAGLCMAALSFPQTAKYFDTTSAFSINLSPFELIPHVLGKCASVKEAREELARVRIVDVPFSKDVPNTPLHWIVSDKSGSIAVEPTDKGLIIYDNKTGVLTNDPPFPFHEKNARFYSHLTSESFMENGIGYGTGAVGLPGDWSSPSRFVKADFLRRTAEVHRGATQSECIDCFFSLLESISVPRGAVRSEVGKPHFTRYSCCIDAQNSIYYCKTYGKMSVSVYPVSKRLMEGYELN